MWFSSKIIMLIVLRKKLHEVNCEHCEWFRIEYWMESVYRWLATCYTRYLQAK